MPYRIAGIDVHKKKLAVVVADVLIHDEYKFERRWYGSHPEQLRLLAEWLIEQQVEEAVMESTAQYWKPVWLEDTASGASLVQSRAARARLRATPAQLRDALGACAELTPVYRRLIKLTLERLQFVEQQR